MRWRGFRRAVAIGLMVVLSAGCATLRGRAGDPTTAVWGWRMPAFGDDLDVESMRAVLQRTIAVAQRRGDASAVANAKKFLELLEITDLRERRDAILRSFRIVRLRDPLLLTGYYEPELVAKRSRDDKFRYPLYGRPTDLIDVNPRELDPHCGCRMQAGRLENNRILPYMTRGEIERGALSGRGLEIAWVDDPVALYSLHVQGSGLLRMPDGSRIAARFAGTNGRPYSSLGKFMLQKGMLPNGASWDRIREAMQPMSDAERAQLFALNERYTFFRISDQRATGSYGTELVAGRSIATDPRYVPLGTIAYVQTPSVRRFVVAQDTGGAIKQAHADLFFGAGEDAELRAGRTKENGTLYLFLPR